MNAGQSKEDKEFLAQYLELGVKLEELEDLCQDALQEICLCLIKYGFVRKNENALSKIKNRDDIHTHVTEIYESDKERYDKVYKKKASHLGLVKEEDE